MSFQPLPDPPTSVVVPEMVPRGTVKTVFNPAADNFAQSLNPFSLYLQDHTTWVQNANQVMYGNVKGVYDDTVVARDAAQQAVTDAAEQVDLATAEADRARDEATEQVGLATVQADRARDEADRAALAVQDSADEAAALATQQAIAQADRARTEADRARTEADRAEIAADDSQTASTSAINAVASISPRLGLNIGSWKLEEGELIVSHLSTAAPSIVQGDFILTYEELEEFA